ncbi:hypothetical protein AB0I66_35465 [Streptomyces sp. NPDC050439]|uniref:hypothetical protein n=1 Tax=unclassified Streptomyces TaxID=2593676 RepID=UPI00342B1913
MRTTRTLRTTAIALVATAGISLGAASGAMAATAPPTTSSKPINVEAVAHSKAKKAKKAKTVKLRDGSIAKVYKLGKNKAKAVISGPKGSTLIADRKTVHVNHNGMHIKLTPSGSITSWMDKAKPKPNPNKRVLVATPKLADGTTAKVYKLSTNHYQADIAGAGSLDANGRAAYGQNNGMHIALQPDGKLTSWMEKAGQDEPAPAPTPDDEVQPDPEPTPDDEVKPDPQPVPDTDAVKPAPKPDPTKTDAQPAPDTGVPFAPAA